MEAVRHTYTHPDPLAFLPDGDENDTRLAVQISNAQSVRMGRATTGVQDLTRQRVKQSGMVRIALDMLLDDFEKNGDHSFLVARLRAMKKRPVGRTN